MMVQPTIEYDPVSSRSPNRILKTSMLAKPNFVFSAKFYLTCQFLASIVPLVKLTGGRQKITVQSSAQFDSAPVTLTIQLLEER